MMFKLAILCASILYYSVSCFADQLTLPRLLSKYDGMQPAGGSQALKRRRLHDRKQRRLIATDPNTSWIQAGDGAYDCTVTPTVDPCENVVGYNLLPIPPNCKQYMLCENHKLSSMFSCAKGRVFDHLVKRCVSEELADCPCRVAVSDIAVATKSQSYDIRNGNTSGSTADGTEYTSGSSREYKGIKESKTAKVSTPKSVNLTETATRARSSTSPLATSSAVSELNIHSIEDMLSQQVHDPDDTTNRTAAPTTMLLRIENASFSDGIHSMGTTTTDDSNFRPNPRDISNAFHTNNSIINSHGASDWLWAFGQFLNHDLSEVNVNKEDFCNITVSPSDPFLHGITSIPMSRSKFQLDESNVAQQLNDMTSIIDAESVYGTTTSRLAYIRSDDSAVTGRLRTSGDTNDLLPKNILGLKNRGGDDRDDLYLAGDVRANENLALLVTHNLWLREHNYWAERIRASKPALDGDSVFEISRVLVRAIMQKIVYDEFLPALIGADSIPEYEGYKEDVDTGLENIVSSCAYRLGHTMVGDFLAKDDGNGNVARVPLEDSFFAPEHIEVHGLDPFLRGMATNTCEEVDPFLVPALRNHLFGEQFDLLALNIERARDHGIPDYNKIRASLGLAELDSFGDFLFPQELESVYDNTDQIDCWIGMNSEPRLDGLMVGPTQQAVLARNFANIRDGDEHFYKNSIKDTGLLELIENTSFADVIRRNSDYPNSLDDIQDNVFFVQQGR